MPLSSNAVFHFTNSKNALLGILRDKFKVKYCRESILIGEKPLEIFVPMVSFCDIPLSEIKQHINSYGNYGIGLTKDWAESKNLNPVFYLEKNSSIGVSIINAISYFIKNKENNKMEINEKEYKDALFSLISILTYTKNYQGPLNRKYKSSSKKIYRFSDEREWRYVPHRSESIKDYLTLKQKNNTATWEKALKSLSQERLHFDVSDIKYIIVKNENQIQHIVNKIKNLYQNQCASSELERLMTRIFTTQQIKEDI